MATQTLQMDEALKTKLNNILLNITNIKTSLGDIEVQYLDNKSKLLGNIKTLLEERDKLVQFCLDMHGIDKTKSKVVLDVDTGVFTVEDN